MLVFWLIAGLLMAGVLLMVLPPLLAPARPGSVAVDAASSSLVVYRDQWAEAQRELQAGLLAADRLQEVRGDIQRRLVDEVLAADRAANAPAGPSRRAALVVGVLLALGSVAGYQLLGEPRGVAIEVAPARTAARGDRHATSPEQLQAMVTNLVERLKAEPGHVEGWAMLARSYISLGRYRDAATAFKRASDLVPGNPSLLADYADVLGMAQGRRLAGEPARLIQAALDIDPRHVKALALAGSVAFEARDYAAAQSYWQRLLAVVPPDSEVARSIQRSLGEARRLEAPPALSQAAAAPAGAFPRATAAPPAAGASPLPATSGTVDIAPALAARIQPGDTLFVFARASQGPRMPLAIVRQPVGNWPQAFALDDSSAMAPELRLSMHSQVTVGVRISRSGKATPQTGDLIGESAVVAPGTQGIRVVVDRVQP